ncbi:membrane protein [Arthrobacter phage Atuin]|nr:membrane protein [Arthrobacter phage Atuin]
MPFAWFMSNLIWDSGIHGIGHYLAVMGSIILYTLVWVGSVKVLERVVEKHME